MTGTIIYFSHGGGPLPILGDPEHRAMNAFMTDLPDKIKKPKAVVVFSAHWEEAVPTVIGQASPELFYDYYGFPPEAYELQYPAPGNPELAKKISGLLSKANIQNSIVYDRGFDHGLFIPLKMMYPEADIPMLQVSLVRGLDPQMHIDLGKALRGLLDDNILIIGSGFSFHNMNEFFRSDTRSDRANDEFQDWLIETCVNADSEWRSNRLVNWEQAPNARYCHPREEHLLPLMVCAGLTNKPAKVIFDDKIANKRAVAFQW